MSVLMHHPESGGEYLATPGQVSHLKESGWEVAPDQDTSEVEEWPDDLKRFEGQDHVKIRHPVSGGETVVGRDAVPYHRERGWVEVGSEDDQAAQADQYEGKTVPELRELAKARGISPLPTTKPELIQALSEPADDQPDKDQAGDEPAPSEEDNG